MGKHTVKKILTLHGALFLDFFFFFRLHKPKLNIGVAYEFDTLIFGISVNRGLLTEILVLVQLLLIILGLLGKINEQCRQPIKVIVNLPSLFSTICHPTSLLPSGCIMSYDQHNGIKLN